MQTFNVYLYLVRMSIKSCFEYRTATIIGIVTALGMFAAEFSLVFMFGLKVGTLNGWLPEELAIIYVMTMLASSIEVLFTDSLRGFSWEIISGTLDTKLLRPVHPLFILSGKINIEAVSIPIFCAGVLAVVVQKTQDYWNLYSVSWFIVSVIGGALIFCSLTVISAAIAFWTYDSDSFYRMTKQGSRQLLWYPMDIYGKGVKIILTFVLPLAFVSYYPSHIIIGKIPEGVPVWFSFITLPVGIVFFGLSLLLWHGGLRHYEGAGG